MTDPLSTSPSEALRASRQRQDFETAVNLLGVGLLMPTTKSLADGTTGWLVRFPRGDDCWTACVASCLQIPIAEVYDSRIDKRLRRGETPDAILQTVTAEFEEWLTGRGYRMVTHRNPPAAGRWIGVIEMGFGRDHCLLMAGDQVLLDPTADLGIPVRIFGLDALNYGVTFEKLTEKEN